MLSISQSFPPLQPTCFGSSLVHKVVAVSSYSRTSRCGHDLRGLLEILLRLGRLKRWAEPFCYHDSGLDDARILLTT